MAPCADEDLLPWVRDVRGVEQIQTEQSVLEEIRTFLWNHEAESVRTATHTVLENYPDWWTKSRRAPPGLSLVQETELEELYRHAGTLFALGIPLTLAERRTPTFRFFQDVEAWGTREATISVDELIGPDRELTMLIGNVMGEVFPGHGGFLDAAVYDATGLSQTKGVRKTSLRLVWPGVLVDAERATRVRDLLVHRLAIASSEEGPLADLEAQLREQNPANAWHSVFGDAAYGARSGVRMPLSDRVSPLPLRAPERRPLSPVGVMRFSFIGESSSKMRAEWLCRQAELDYPEWIKIGCLRQDEDAKLTEWAVPSWPGNLPIPPSSTRTGRVKVRTAAGSEGGGGLRLRASARGNAPERAGQLLTVERRFTGAPELFCEKMEAHLGKAAVEADGSLVWKPAGVDARIVMFGEDKRVRVIGRPNQVRSLVVIVAPYTEAQPGLGAGAGRQLGPGPLPDGRAPGAAFAPVVPPALVGDSSEGAEIGASAAAINAKDDGPAAAATAGGGVLAPEDRRVAKEAFEAQGQGELALAVGEAVCVMHDPEGELGSGSDRWVYGRNEATELCGWFPLSHTVPHEEWKA